MNLIYFKRDDMIGSYLKVVPWVLQIFLLVFTYIECL
jgi:hypothetical protein